MGLRFSHVKYRYDTVPALQDVTLEAQRGEILCLLGRSGCGKSTLLNLTAGLLRMQSGEIYLNGDLLASPRVNPPPERRGVGLVFQDGALFPHLTVAQNIAFGIKDRTTRKQRVNTLLDQIGLSDFADRYPHTLSGGQQQRVAVARALAPQPGVLLMDEPFASIDISLRRNLREETRRIIKEQDAATILVTHDPEEALEIADRVAVMEGGRITQVGTAQELHDRPASLFVGMMAGNGTVLPAQVADGMAQTDFGQIALDDLRLGTAQTGGNWTAHKTVNILIQPDNAMLKPDPDGHPIADVRRTGRSQIVTIQNAKANNLLLEVGTLPDWSVGQRVSLHRCKDPWLAFPT
jgi:iron(III) transport system ATP-binding protein